MRTIINVVWRTRRRKVFTLASLGALATTGAAVAAFIVFTGVSGSTSGTIETATINAAITVTENSAPGPIPVGGSANGSIKLTNVDTKSHTLTAITGTFSSTPSECAPHLSYSFGGSDPVGTALAAGANVNVPVSYSAAAATPASCSNASWTATWTGTTNP